MQLGDSPDDSGPQYRLGERRAGGFYTLRGHPSLFVRITQDRLQLLEETRERSEDLPDDVNFSKPLEIGVYEGPEFDGERRAMVLERPLGHVVHDENNPRRKRWRRTNQLLAEAPQQHYDKLVDDVEVLEEAGMRIDPASASNFFYHPDNGFTVVPASHGNELSIGFLAIPLAATYLVEEFDEPGFTEKDVENLHMIYQKLRAVGAPRDDHFEAKLLDLQNGL